VFALGAIRRHTRFIETRADELEQFATRVAHDLQGPLQPVALVLQSARKRLSEGDPSRGVFDCAIRSVSRLTFLIQDLLAFARAGGSPEPGMSASVRAGVDAALEEASGPATTAGIEVKGEAPADLVVACSRGVLASLLSNLVRNAVKYMGDAPVRDVIVAARRCGGRVRIEVRDTGPGLSPGAEAQVFDPYVRADRTGQPGLGLGLATVKRLTEAHGGAVGVQSSAAGCAFWFELPEGSIGSRRAPQAARPQRCSTTPL
jgi:signal transduction histidine kinase